MGTGKKKIPMEKIPSIKNRRVTLSKRHRSLFNKLRLLQAKYKDFGFVVASVVFSAAGNVYKFGDMLLLDRFEEANSEVWDGGEVEQMQMEIDDCELRLGMNWDGENEAIRLGLEELQSAVDDCDDYDALKGLKKKLQEFKGKKFAGAYVAFVPREAALSQPVSNRGKLFGYIERKYMDSLEKQITDITVLCDVDGFFICATKGADGVPTEFHTWPNDKSMVRRLIRQYVFSNLNKSKKKRVGSKSKTIVSEEESSHSMLTKVFLVGKIDSLIELVDKKLKMFMDCHLLTEFCDSFVRPSLFEFQLQTALEDASVENSSDSFDCVYSDLG